MTLTCHHCGNKPTRELTGPVPNGEAVYCRPCLKAIMGYAPTKPVPDAGGALNEKALLSGKACGICYDRMRRRIAGRASRVPGSSGVSA